MKSLKNTDTSGDPLKHPLRAIEAIRYDELARERYEHHKGVAKFYLRRTAVLMGFNVACCALALFVNSRIFIIASGVSCLVLLLRKVEGSLATHMQATIEYKMSLDEFEAVEDTNGMLPAIRRFEERCQRFEPCSILIVGTPQKK